MMKIGEKTRKNFVLMILFRIIKISPTSPKIDSRALTILSDTQRGRLEL
jgi:hypothetical protein